MLRRLDTGEILANEVEVLRTPVERARGMLKYSKPPSSLATVFDLPLFGVLPIVHSYGMKFPIDVFYCDSQKKIIFSHKNFSPGGMLIPWKLLAGGARYLVEMASSTTAREIPLGTLLQWEAS